MLYTDEQILDIVIDSPKTFGKINNSRLKEIKSIILKRGFIIPQFELDNVNSLINALALPDSTIKLEHAFSNDAMESYLNLFTKRYKVGNTAINIEENMMYCLNTGAIIEKGYIIEEKYLDARKLPKESNDHNFAKIKNEPNLVILSRMEKTIRDKVETNQIDFHIILLTPIEKDRLIKILTEGKDKIEKKFRNKKSFSLPK